MMKKYRENEKIVSHLRLVCCNYGERRILRLRYITGLLSYLAIYLATMCVLRERIIVQLLSLKMVRDIHL